MCVRPLALPLLAALAVLGLSACNDKATDIGAVLVPGTDTVYTITSADKPLLDTLQTLTQRVPLFNSQYVLFGKTFDSEARLFIEFLNYPSLGDSSAWHVVESHLQVIPQAYVFGDTLNTTIGMRGYNLSKVWSAQATWDSIWAPDGSTDYYSTASPPVVDASISITSVDSINYIPFDVNATRNWLVAGADSATRVNTLFGFVLLSTNTSSIRQFRNLNGQSEVLLLRVITQHKDSALPDTNWLRGAVACFVDSPPAQPDELVVQGTRIHRSSITAHIDSLPEYAIIVGATFVVELDEVRSQIGSLGPDELLQLTYTAADGSLFRYTARINENRQYVFDNISAAIQRIRSDGGTGALVLYPGSQYETWRMNRLVFHTEATDSSKKPKLTILYTVPTVFQ